MTWLSDWQYRKEIAITSRAEGSLSNYQLLITLFSGAGTDSPGIVHLENNIQNWPYDIRFTKSDGTTELNYWYEDSGSEWSGIRSWINIPSINDSNSTNYYIYYGSSNAAYNGNGNNVWGFYDDFSSDSTGDYTEDIEDSHTSWVNHTRATSSNALKRIIHKFGNINTITGTETYGTSLAIGTTVDRSSYDENICYSTFCGTDFFSSDTDTTEGVIFRISGATSVQGNISDDKDYISEFLYISANSASFISGTVRCTDGTVILDNGVSCSFPWIMEYESDRFVSGWGTGGYDTFSYDSTTDSIYLRTKRGDHGTPSISGNLYYYCVGQGAYPEPTWDTPGGESTESVATHYDEGDSLRIYISCNNYPNNYIDCFCTRWDESNESVTFETVLGSGARNFLFQNVVPGAVTNLYTILGEPYNIDSTYSSSNTIIISPLGGTGLSGLRQERVIGVKNISDTFWVPNKFSVKVEGIRINGT